MASADHRGDRLLACLAVRRLPGKWTQPLPFGKTKCGTDCLVIGMVARGLSVLVVDAGDPEFLDHAPLTISTSTESPRLAEGVSRIVDIAGAHKALRNAVEIRFPNLAPAPFAELAGEIGTKLRPRRRVLSDIAQSQLVQLALIEGGQGSTGPGACHNAVFVPQSLGIRKWTARHAPANDG